MKSSIEAPLLVAKLLKLPKRANRTSLIIITFPNQKKKKYNSFFLAYNFRVPVQSPFSKEKNERNVSDVPKSKTNLSIFSIEASN
jgi:hypothetical protein